MPTETTAPSLPPSSHLLKEPEEVPLVSGLLALLVLGEFDEFSAALGLDVHVRVDALLDAVEDDVERPRQQTHIGV